MREEDFSQRRASPKTPSDARKPGIYFCNYPFSSAFLRLLIPMSYWEQPIRGRMPWRIKVFLAFYTKLYAGLSSGIALLSAVHTSVTWTRRKSHLAGCDSSRENIFEIATNPASCEERMSNVGNVFLRARKSSLQRLGLSTWFSPFISLRRTEDFLAYS